MEKKSFRVNLIGYPKIRKEIKRKLDSEMVDLLIIAGKIKFWLGAVLITVFCKKKLDIKFSHWM